MATKKSGVIQTRNLIKKHRLLFVILVILLTIIGLFIKNQLEVRQNKQDFEYAQQAINNVYDKVVEKVGKPDASEHTQSCDYASMEFGRGQLGCVVRIGFVYAVKNGTEATDLARRVDSAISSTPNELAKTFSNVMLNLPFKDIIGKQEYREVSNDYTETTSQLHCSLVLIYADRSNPHISISTTISVQNLSVNLACRGQAKKPFYQLSRS